MRFDKKHRVLKVKNHLTVCLSGDFFSFILLFVGFYCEYSSLFRQRIDTNICKMVMRPYSLLLVSII